MSSDHKVVQLVGRIRLGEAVIHRSVLAHYAIANPPYTLAGSHLNDPLRNQRHRSKLTHARCDMLSLNSIMNIDDGREVVQVFVFLNL
jgi:hypothetical protein